MTSASTNLQDQHVVLLGGTSGIGLATAHAALAAGASVTVVSSRSQRVAEALARLGDRAKGYTVDLTNESAVRELFEQLGPFDHLVYSAGDSLQIGALVDMELDTVRQLFDVRVFGAIAAVKHAAPYLRPGGSVVSPANDPTRGGWRWPVSAVRWKASRGHSRWSWRRFASIW
jgi:NAD(P)-dependent dehydrogenase (short-subunit alcohol dehydrogenase family)